jgi:hypothetical protein
MNHLEEIVTKAWQKTKENIKTRRYFHPSNYVSDLVAGNVSRVPLYMAFDNAIVGVPDEKVIGSAMFGLGASICGWSLVYALGNSMLATALGETYQKHAKKIDAVYSATITFGFGMAVNLASGYNLEQATTASVARGLMAVPLGPFTRWYTDSLREMRGEKPIAKETKFKDKDWKYCLHRAAVMTLLPLAFAGAVLTATPKDHKPLHQYLFQSNTQIEESSTGK